MTESAVPSPDSDPNLSAEGDGVDSGTDNRSDDSTGAASTGGGGPTGGASPFQGPSEGESDLPEEFVMTPEFAEEEAQRGDFVIRWAVVLLAALLGCTAIYETVSLVHVRSGEAIASNYGIAPSTDSLSYSIGEQTWANTSWLFDVVVAGVHAVTGWVGLSLFKAIIAAITFALIVHINREHVPTWWSSITAMLALLICYPQFTIQPFLMTFPGIALTLYLLHQWREDNNTRAVWWLVPLFVVWGNLDPRMFLGLAILVLYLIGEVICQTFKLCAHLEPTRLKNLAVVTWLCLIAAVVNRFHIHALLAPWELYTNYYPNLLKYGTPADPATTLARLPMSHEAVWSMRTHHTIAGLIVIALSFLSIGLNRKRASLGDLLVLIGLAPLAFFAWHQLAPVALVAAVIGSLNAQQWYQERFRQTYSIETKEMMFSRGGRALTVFALFVIGFLSTSGRLDGASGRRSGVGLSSGLATLVEDWVEEIPLTYDDHPFHQSMRQGDLIIWSGKKSFTDSRVLPFINADSNLLERQSRIMLALHTKIPDLDGSGRPDIYEPVFDKYEITTVLPEIDSEFASGGYSFMFDFMTRPDRWRWTHQGLLAIFHRIDPTNEQLSEFNKDRTFNPVKEAFKEAEPLEDIARVDWAESGSFWTEMLSKPGSYRTASAIRARHYQSLPARAAQRGLTMQPDVHIALDYLTLRQTLKSLATTPDSVLAYRIQAAAYQSLLQSETGISQQGRSRFTPALRVQQILMALRQAEALAPNDIDLQIQLLSLYNSLGYQEFLFEMLNQRLAFLRDTDTPEDANEAKSLSSEIESIDAKVKEMEVMFDQVEQMMNDELSKDSNPFPLARKLRAQGLIKRALGLYEQSIEKVNADPSMRLQLERIQLLISNGRYRDAHDELQALEGLADDPRLSGMEVRRKLAELETGLGRHERALELLEAELETFEQIWFTMLREHPVMGGWPGTNSVTMIQNLPPFVQAFNTRETTLLYDAGVIALELGDLEKAEEFFRRMLEAVPEGPGRPLAFYYLQSLSDEAINPYSEREMEAIRRSQPVIAPRPDLSEQDNEE